MFDRLHCRIYTFSGALAADGILTGAKFTLRPSLAFSYWQPCCTALEQWASAKLCGVDKEGTFAPRLRHLYFAGRPSRWASAHILVSCDVIFGDH